MRVLLDNIIFSLQTCGGISGTFARLIEGLAADSDIDLWFLERKDAADNIFRRRLTCIPGERIIDAGNMPITVDRYRNISRINGWPNDGEPFIFHSSYYRYCKLPGAVNITTVHDFTYEVMRLRSYLSTAVHSMQKKAAIVKSAGIACVSNSTMNDLHKIVGVRNDQNAKVIPNAPLCCFENRGGDEYNVRSMRDVLYVGARTYHKNFKLLVRALAGTHWRLILCSSALTADESRFVERALKPGQYEIFVYPDDKTLSEIYRRCRCLVYPSSYEGFGIPIVEAQQYGLPVITGDCPASVEVGGGSTIVLSDYSVEAVIKAIEALDDSELYARLSSEGKKNAARFKWNNIVEAYKYLYYDSIGES